ncbi:uncharacterized protein LOC143285617 [Babylonia areolata]|uniref:uncharacterized protein LOC143285617 n=1 Tax=Babylonia areolata TaxID=304850 RepID=UPI003FCF82C1
MTPGTEMLWLPVVHFISVTWEACAAVEVNGAGASFPVDVYSAWIPAYKAHRRPFRQVEMKYDSVGSGDGKARIKGVKGPPVTYAGSDSLLKEEEYQAYPDLQMLPSMAGAVVMAFNIPGLRELRLSMEHIAAIYNGTVRRWNHPALLGLNPLLTPLDQEIRVAARRDKSGTTELFTAALSAADENWRNSYGTFSLGLRANDTPHVWNPNVVTLYGETNRGVSGMVMSTKYSIGYLVLSDAVTAKLPFATLLNSAGNLVDATVESVQSTMEDFATSLSVRMTQSLGNPRGRHSYPICGYTYLIIHMSSMTDCLQATELVRYIEWFYTDPIARKDCENQYMVPLSQKVYGRVMERVVRRVTCRGANVYSMVLEDRAEEELSLQTWRTPVYIAVPIIGVLMVVLILYLVRDQIRTNRALLRDEWRIPPKDINFSPSHDKFFGSCVSVSKSRVKVHPSMTSMESSTPDTLAAATSSEMQGKRVGHYRSQQRVLLTELPMLTSSVSLAMKRGILRLRDGVRHDNVTKFYGLFLDGGSGPGDGGGGGGGGSASASAVFCSVSQLCSNGDLQNMLHSNRYNMDNNFKFALCACVAKGLNYLHANKLVHGSLTSSKIYLDDNWNLRVSVVVFEWLSVYGVGGVGGWEVNVVASLQKKMGVVVDMEVEEWTQQEFWTAPEVLSQKSLPTPASDIYSLAIVMQEIFSRDMPYADQSAFMTPSETLAKVVCESLRPFFTPDTPLEAREIMQGAWEMDPLARPSARHVLSALKRACPKTRSLTDCILDSMCQTRSLIDCMLDSLLQYVHQLEETQRLMAGAQVDKADSQHHTMSSGTVLPQTNTGDARWQQRLMTLPPAIAQALGSADLSPRLVDSASVLVMCVASIDHLLRVSTPQDVIELVGDVQQGVTTLLDTRFPHVLQVEGGGASYTLAVGLTKHSADHLKTAACLALDLLTMASTFTIRHCRNDRLSLRVGLGTGNVVMGLTGSDVARLSLFGKAVGRAQSMCDSCLPSAIQLNDAAHTALATFKYFTCVERKECKDKSNAGKSYWLVSHRNMTETFNPENLSH